MVFFILKRLVAGVLLWLLLFLLCLWLIRLIPGSYEDLSKLEAPMEETQSLLTPGSLPVFYWSLIPDPGVQQSLSDLLPQVKWNGRNNAFHQQLGGYVRLDFGQSLIDQIRVSDKIKPALLWSLALQIPAIFLIVALSLWIGLRLVRFPDSSIWSGVNAGLLGLHSIPGFWLATLLLLLFANPDAIAWLPTGMQAAPESNPFRLWLGHPQFYVLPLLSLVLPALAYLSGLIRNGLDHSMHQAYWKRALSSGLGIKQALKWEALPVALIPVVAWTSGILPALISGALIIEQIFSIPGLGRLMLLSINLRDWPVVQFIFLLGAAMTILGFLVADVLLRLIDPRIQSRE